MKEKTRLALHIQEWKNCERCYLHVTRHRTALVRGTVPCDVLFIGEAPGETEDSLGYPFVGRAGKFLDEIIASVLSPSFTRCFTNLIGCIPRVGDTYTVGELPSACVKLCKPRVEDLIAIANPQLIVTVGKVAKVWLDPDINGSVSYPAGVPVVDIFHPAYLLRLKPPQQGSSINLTEVKLRNAFREYLEGPRDAVANAKTK